jgi:hypothetical protein
VAAVRQAAVASERTDRAVREVEVDLMAATVADPLPDRDPFSTER